MDWKRYFSWQRWQCLIYSGLLKPKSGKKFVSLTRKVYFILRISPLLLISKKCAINFHWETANENKQFNETKTLIYNSYLIRQSFKGYRCKSGIVISSHGEPLEITLTVRLIMLSLCHWFDSVFFFDKQCPKSENMIVLHNF